MISLDAEMFQKSQNICIVKNIVKPKTEDMDSVTKSN